MTRKKAFVTGASRGIGKAIALRLARGGYDVAITARTVREGESREHSSTVRQSNTRPLPGSLSSTAALMRGEGADVLVLPADLTDRASLGAAAATLIERWGAPDLVIHNGRFIGPGHMDGLLDTPIAILEKHVEGNAMAPLILTHHLLPPMLRNGGGTIIYITSTGGQHLPPGKPGQGGWGLSYSMSKAAGHTIARHLAVEYGDQGIRAFNLQPGAIRTERIVQDMAEFGFGASFGEPAEVIGEVAYWIATSAEADQHAGMCIEGQNYAYNHGLLPGWTPQDSTLPHLQGPEVHH
jgi:NAD(P)-dependent dehydrogenase (short-subunit alcohol dehydrogenase family)